MNFLIHKSARPCLTLNNVQNICILGWVVGQDAIGNIHIFICSTPAPFLILVLYCLCVTSDAGGNAVSTWSLLLTCVFWAGFWAPRCRELRPWLGCTDTGGTNEQQDLLVVCLRLSVLKYLYDILSMGGCFIFKNIKITLKKEIHFTHVVN